MLSVLSENGIEGGSDTLFLKTVDELHKLAHDIAFDPSTDVDIKLAHGNPAVEILAEAAGSQAGLIVMGAADYSVFDTITHDHTICQVLAHAYCPVLTLHGSTARQFLKEADLVAAH